MGKSLTQTCDECGSLYRQTLAGYRRLLETHGFAMLVQEEIGAEMGEDYRYCVKRIKGELKEQTLARFGQEGFEGACQLFQLLADSVTQGHLGRGRFVARKA